MATLPKVMELHRVHWFHGQHNSMEDQLREIWSQRSTSGARTIQRPHDELIIGLKHRDQRNRFAIHGCKCTVGEAIGAIPMDDLESIDIIARLPRENENFVRGDFAAVFIGNYVVAIGAGINASLLSAFTNGLFDLQHSANSPDYAHQYTKVADLEAVQLLQNEQIAKIQVNATMAETFSDELSEIVESDTSESLHDGALSGIATYVKALLSRTPEASALISSQKTEVSISIVPKRGEMDVVYEELHQIAEDLLEECTVGDIDPEEDDLTFKIVTKNGLTFTPSSISLRKKDKIERSAGSFSIVDAWNKCDTFVDELSDSGILSD